ncbi:MAG TPA: multidrug ABC transporter ATP-binding protein, partial [Lactobacillus acetotolerans]|nr:multidrug ABC transporter ATP-binding protein [Lactobacillus acetotolerans]
QQAVSEYAVLNNGTIEIVGSLQEIRTHYGLKPTDTFDKLYQILNQEQQNE